MLAPSAAPHPLADIWETKIWGKISGWGVSFFGIGVIDESSEFTGHS